MGRRRKTGKKEGQDVNGNQLHFQRSQIEANFFFFSSMYRLLVPAHILSAKRALYHRCSWFVSGWCRLQTCLQSSFLLLLFILLSVILFIFYSKWMCIICLEAFLLSHKARCPHHHHHHHYHISWSSYVSPVCIRHTHPLTKPLSRSGPFPQLCFNHTCAPPFSTHTHRLKHTHTHTHTMITTIRPCRGKRWH